MNINTLSHEELVNKIINQANTLNKKIKQFREANIKQHYNLIESMFTDKQVEYTKSGAITKSTKFYGKQHDLQLKKTLNTLIKISKHEVYGTVKKYERMATAQFESLKETAQQYLQSKGYSRKEVTEITSSIAFFNSLFIAFSDMSGGFGSMQTIEKVFLEYRQDDRVDDKEMKKFLFDFEQSYAAEQRIKEEQKEYKEWLEYKRKNDRR